MVHARYLAIAPLFVAFAGPAAAEDEFDRILAFEGAHREGAPLGWYRSSAKTVAVDPEVVHGGKHAVRITRAADAKQAFSVITKALPVDFAGKTVELSGFLRVEDVSKYAGLWLRVDGADKKTLRIDNMRDQNLNGTKDWASYRVTVPLGADARKIVFGALLVGTGILWVDDLKLVVDGKPIQQATKIERARSPLETDKAFDAGSGIDVSSLTDAQVDHLVLLGKLWGFLKYHHTKVTGGKLHWDYELFRVLPAVLAAKDRAAAQAAIQTWYESRVGVPAVATPPAKPGGELHIHPDLDWTRDEALLGAPLCAALQQVYVNRHAGGAQFYVTLAGTANPTFTNELRYVSVKYPDVGYRLLAVLRYWNIIAYWFPYRDLIVEDWDGVLRDSVRRIVAAKDADAYRLQMMALIARVHDSHANLWGSLDVRPPRGSCVVPVLLRFLDGKAVVTGSRRTDGALPAGIEVGDVLVTLDGRTLDSMIEAWAPLYAASNDAARRRDFSRYLTIGDAGPCEVTLVRAGQTQKVMTERVSMDVVNRRLGRTHDRAGDTFQKLSDDVAYLKLSSVDNKKAAEYVEAAKGTKALIIDIRNYPTSFMVFALGGRLVSETTSFARFTNGDLENPGAFGWGYLARVTPIAPRYEGRVAILVDEVSQSQAEYTAMALRAAPGALVVGSTTAGADGNVSHIPLPGGLRSMISGIGVFYPDKTPTQRVGVQIDVPARPTIEGIREGRDEVLEVALRRVLGDSVSDEEIVRMAKR